MILIIINKIDATIFNHLGNSLKQHAMSNEVLNLFFTLLVARFLKWETFNTVLYVQSIKFIDIKDYFELGKLGLLNILHYCLGKLVY